MKNSPTPILRSSITLAFAGLVAGLCVTACDLRDKNLGDDPSGTTGDPDICEPGQTKMEDCNTCSCEGGVWSCTEIACGDSSGGLSCDPDEEPIDDCNECVCDQGSWICTAIGCPPGSDTGSDTGSNECDPDTEPMDGCNECFCDMGEWACTEIACPGSPEVGVCDGSEPLDPFSILDASVVDHELLLSVEYSGGCAEHIFGSCWDEAFAESRPVQAGVTISHEDNDDPCDGIENQQLSYDLSPLRNAWIDSYQQLSGTITLYVAGWGPIDYSF